MKKYMVGFSAGVLIMTALMLCLDIPEVSLPEEYNLITKDTPIRGYYQNDSLYIEFDHSIKFLWNNALDSLPKDGEHIRIEYTHENSVYLNTIQ